MTKSTAAVGKASASFSNRLLRWFDQHGRTHLPWQKRPTAYRVWISEIMLQQTQVNTVVPYYEKFMRRFPTLEALAAAGIDDVLAHWSGLGYYARARNLHKAARVLVNECGGKFPRSVETLEQLPGIGRSTAGAIASLAFRQRAVILDGNVKRVLARYHAVRGAITDTRTLDHLWQLADAHTPYERVNNYTQAIMDLGATLCTRTKPRCDECPLKRSCLARKNNTQHLFPQKKTKTVALPIREIRLLLIVNPDGEVLLQQRPAKGIWGGLWSLPELALDIDARQWCRETLGFRVKKIEEWAVLPHTFSHFHWRIHPLVLTLANLPERQLSAPGVWVKPGIKNPAALRKGLAAPVRKLLDQL